MVSSTFGALERLGRRHDRELGFLLQPSVIYLVFCYFCLFFTNRGDILDFLSQL